MSRGSSRLRRVLKCKRSCQTNMSVSDLIFDANPATGKCVALGTGAFGQVRFDSCTLTQNDSAMEKHRVPFRKGVWWIWHCSHSVRNGPYAEVLRYSKIVQNEIPNISCIPYVATHFLYHLFTCKGLSDLVNV